MLVQSTKIALEYGATMPYFEGPGMIDLSSARARLREAAMNYWVALRENDSDRANEESATSDGLVKAWADRDKVREFLEPLLRDADPEVRFAAASHLLNHRDDATALAVLEELQRQDSMVAPTARLRLVTWSRDHQ